MIRHHRSVYWMVALVLILASGCSSAPAMLTPTEKPIQTEITPVQSTATVTPLTEATVTPAIRPSHTPTMAPVEEPLPDVLLHYQTISDYSCSYEDNAQIWLSQFPYNNTVALLAQSGIDYSYPSWSPDGQLIAYVESRQSDLFDPSNQRGVASIWVPHPDGSQTRRVSDYLPRENFLLQGCQSISFISSQPRWSCDGTYLLIEHTNLNSTHPFSYYLIEVGSGIMKLISQGSVRSHPQWFFAENSIAYVSPSNELMVTTIHTIDRIETQTIPLPPSLNPEGQLQILPDFYHFGHVSAETILVTWNDSHSEVYELWTISMESGKWNKIQEIDQSTAENTLLANGWAVTCTDQGIALLDEDTWDVLSSFEAGNININCDVFALFENQAGHSLAGFSGSISARYQGQNHITAAGIWVIRLQDQKLVPALYQFPGPDAKGTYSYSIWSVSFAQTNR